MMNEVTFEMGKWHKVNEELFLRVRCAVTGVDLGYCWVHCSFEMVTFSGCADTTEAVIFVSTFV